MAPIRVKKEVARPGTNWYIDETTGLPQKAEFTPETLQYWLTQGQAMIDRGLSIPVPLEHQRDARPMSAAEKAAWNTTHNAGWVAGYEMQKIKDEAGKDIEALFANVDILDPEIAKKLPHTIRWTSPWISSFVDGQNRRWDGVISHLALTTRPRILKQQPFPSVDAAMSLAGMFVERVFDPKKLPLEAGGFSLSRAGRLLKQPETGRFCPVYPNAFASWSGIGLATDKLPPEKDDKEGGAKPKEGTPDEKLDESGLTEPEKALIDEDGDIQIYEVIQDLLEAMGVLMDPGTNADNFYENLYKAIMAKVKGGDSVTPANNATGNPSSQSKAGTVQEQPPLYMSLEDVQKVQDPNQRALALSIFYSHQENAALKKRLETVEANALANAKAFRQTRLNRLATKVKPETMQKLLAQVDSATFSLQPDGKVLDSLDVTLSLLEDSIPDLPALLTANPASLSTQPHPREYQGEMSEERRQAVVKELARGLPPVALPNAN